MTAGVRIYEQVRGGAMVAVNRGDLAMDSVPASRIAGYHLNSSNMVDYIILSDVTGDAYEYGIMVAQTKVVTENEPIKDKNGKDPDDEDWIPTYKEVNHNTTSWSLMRSSGEITFTDNTGYSGRSGDMVGVVTDNPMGQADGKTLAAIIQLTEVKNVKPSDFFDSQGVPHVTVNGRTYRVSDDVECCRYMGSSRPGDADWLAGSGAERLAAIRAYSDNLTIYVDPVGQQVRVIKAN